MIIIIIKKTTTVFFHILFFRVSLLNFYIHSPKKGPALLYIQKWPVLFRLIK